MQENASHKQEALAALTKLNEAIERRREADAAVGRAHHDLAAVEIRNALSVEAVNSALRDFSAVAMHW